MYSSITCSHRLVSLALAHVKSAWTLIKIVAFVSAALMSSIYEDHKDEDGFLYVTYSGENTYVV